MGKKSRARKRAESRRAARENESQPQDSDSVVDESVDDAGLANSDLTSDEYSDQLSPAMEFYDSSQSPADFTALRPSRLPIRVTALPLSCGSSPTSSPRSPILAGDKKSRIPRLISLRELIKTRSGYNSETSDESHLETFNDNLVANNNNDDDNDDDEANDADTEADTSSSEDDTAVPEHVYQANISCDVTSRQAIPSVFTSQTSATLEASKANAVSSSTSASFSSSTTLIPLTGDGQLLKMPSSQMRPLWDTLDLSFTLCCSKIAFNRFIL